MQLVNIKTSRIAKCAFCQLWYDPTNAGIRPRSAAAGFWEYDPRMRAECQRMNTTTAGAQGCSHFVSKI